MEITLDFSTFLRPFLAVALTFLLSQGAKWMNDLKLHKRVKWGENGGMPSSHSATVIGLALVVLIETGLSMLFLVALIFAAVVINDALMVRWETSRHSKFLNELSKTSKFKVVGHKPMEVLVGVLIGIVVPLLFYSFF